MGFVGHLPGWWTSSSHLSRLPLSRRRHTGPYQPLEVPDRLPSRPLPDSPQTGNMCQKFPFSGDTASGAAVSASLCAAAPLPWSVAKTISAEHVPPCTLMDGLGKTLREASAGRKDLSPRMPGKPLGPRQGDVSLPRGWGPEPSRSASAPVPPHLLALLPRLWARFVLTDPEAAPSLQVVWEELPS